jgi:hypothetical protein
MIFYSDPGCLGAVPEYPAGATSYSKLTTLLSHLFWFTPYQSDKMLYKWVCGALLDMGFVLIRRAD